MGQSPPENLPSNSCVLVEFIDINWNGIRGTEPRPYYPSPTGDVIVRSDWRRNPYAIAIEDFAVKGGISTKKAVDFEDCQISLEEMVELVWKKRYVNQDFSGFVVSGRFDFQWDVNVINSEENEGFDKLGIDAQERFVHWWFLDFSPFY